MKKILALITTLAMLITLIPATLVSADGSVEVENVGSPIMRTQMVSYTVTQQDGVPVLVGLCSGSPAHLVVMNLMTHTFINDYEIEYGSTFYAITRDANGDVYFAGYAAPIHLYKYSVTTKTVTDLGLTEVKTGALNLSTYTAKAICDMTTDGTNIYLATYPDSHILKWDGSKLSDLVSIYKGKNTLGNADSFNNGDDYLKSIGYYNGNLYCGGNKEGTYLVKYNLSNGSRTRFDLTLPGNAVLSSMYHANIVGNRMFIYCYTVSSGRYTAVFDLDNEIWKTPISNSGGNYATASADGQYAYIVQGVKMKKYNLSTDTFEQAAFTGDIGSIRCKDSAVFGGNAYTVYVATGRSYMSVIRLDNGVIVNPGDCIPKYPDMLESFALDSEGNIYASVYQGGIASKYDPYTNEVIEEFSMGQATAIKEFDGKVYFGTYPSADLCVYDPNAPVVSGSNPKQLLAMPEENQGRPMDIVKSGDKIIMSTIGGYGDANGKSSGCIVIYDTTTKKYIKYKGGDMEDYQMVGLYIDENDVLYVSTSVVGGHNSTPVYNNAKIFNMYLSSVISEPITATSTEPEPIYPDEEVQLKLSDYGKSGTGIAHCGGFAKDPNADKLWCVCHNGIFSLNMNTMKLGDFISIGNGPSYQSRWQPYSIEFDSAGNLYATPDNTLYRINTENKSYTKIVDDAYVMHLQQGSLGTAIYYMGYKGDTIYVIDKQPQKIIPESADGWYLITSPEEFMYIKEEPTANYKLMNDITLGTEENPFTEPFAFEGVFDGQNHTIDVNIKTSGQSAGLFSNELTAGKKIEIKNLTLTGSVAKVDTNAAMNTTFGTDCSVGAFVGCIANHTTFKFENLVNKATVSGGARTIFAGGIVGRTYGNALGYIKNCKNFGNVSSDFAGAWVGGIAGMFSGTISECLNSGAVSGTGSAYAGGLVGDVRKGAKIEKSANFGAVTHNSAGGLLGRFYELDASGGISDFTVENCFNAGSVTATNASGFVGSRQNASTTTTLVLTNCYNIGVVNASSRARTILCIGNDDLTTTTSTNVWYDVKYVADGVSNKAKQFTSAQTTLADLGFDEDVWTWDTSVFEYPYITSLGVVGTGTRTNPYEIKTEADFMAIQNNPSACYKLMNDIDIGTAEAPFTAPFEFTGVFDGDGHTITAYITTTGIPVGLFSKNSQNAKSVEIKNLTLKGRIERTATESFVNSPEASVGGFIGYSADYAQLTLENCVNKATVIGNNSKCVGGLVGYCNGFTESTLADSIRLIDCTNMGEITCNNQGDMQIGGIAGYGAGTVRNCVNMGSISGKCSYMGGIIGGLGKTGDFNKCCNLGNMSTLYSFGQGGLVGIVWSNGAIFTNCFNAGAVVNSYSGSLAGAGGLVGRGVANTTTAAFTNCYNSGNVTCGYAANGNQIAGYMNGGFTATNVYCLASNTGVEGACEFGTKTTLAELGFGEDVWVWNRNSMYAYPIFKGIKIEGGTDQFPIYIETKEDFLKINENPTASYLLANDIDLGSYVPFEFKGHLIGFKDEETGEYPALNVDLNMPEALSVGLFSKIDGYVRIEGIKVTGTIRADGIAGSITGLVGVRDSGADTLTPGSYIKNCVNEADITVIKSGTDNQSGRSAGGFVGYYGNGAGRNLTLSNLENRGNIFASNSYAGGIGGRVKGFVTDCINKGNISGDNCIGGIVGFAYDNRAITGCINMGDITAESIAGGIVGQWQHPNATVIENCYNMGNITAERVSGWLIGKAFDTSTANARNCYNIGKLNGSYCDTVYGSQENEGTFTNVLSLTIDGDTDEDDATIGIAGLKNAATGLGTAFVASTNDYDFPQLKNNIITTPIDILMIESNGIGTEGASVDMATNVSGRQAMLVMAVYNSDGSLDDVVTDMKAIGEGKTHYNVTATVDQGQTAKIMLWDQFMHPYCNAV